MFKKAQQLPYIPSSIIGLYPSFQDGGGMVSATPAGMPPQSGEDAMLQLVGMAQEALETQNVELMTQVCEIVVQALGGAQAAPEAEAPMPEGEQPVMKKGGEMPAFMKKKVKAGEKPAEEKEGKEEKGKKKFPFQKGK